MATHQFGRNLARAGLILASVLIANVAHADVYIANDPGGLVTDYIQKYQYIRATGEHVVIDGPCYSACTLVTGLVPRNRVCVTSRAELGFHEASVYDDVSRSLVPTRKGTKLVERLYPRAILAWINHHGGWHPQLLIMRGRDLAAFYSECQ